MSQGNSRSTCSSLHAYLHNHVLQHWAALAVKVVAMTVTVAALSVMAVVERMRSLRSLNFRHGAMARMDGYVAY